MSQRAHHPWYFDRASSVPEVLLLLIAGIAAFLFVAMGVARVTGWELISTVDAGAIPASGPAAIVPAAGEARAMPRCPECGVIVSMREVEGRGEDVDPVAAAGTTTGNGNETPAKKTRNYEIIVRMADGTDRSIYAANPARWRTGERLMVIAGTGPSQP
jgi:outer membrane lipoprotein SlyB